MKALGIGYGRHIFDTANFEHQRLARCAGELTSFDQIIFTNTQDSFSVLEAENNFTVHPTQSKSKLTMIFDAVRIGSEIIKEKNIEVVTCQDVFETGLVGMLLKSRFPNVRLQVQEHGDVMSSKHWRSEKISNLFRYVLARIVLRQADIVRVVSKRTEVFLRDTLKVDAKIVRLPVVTDTQSFSQVMLKKLDTNHFTFLTAARFVPQKNFPLMLQAFAEVLKENQNVRLIIFGEGPEEKKIKRMVADLKLEEFVDVSGWTDNLAAEMAKANAYLLTSNYEGWGRVLIESVLQKLPVVTTDVGCANEVIEDGEHGLIVPIDDKKALVDAMVRISSDEVALSQIKEYLERISINDIPGTDIDAYALAWRRTLE
jgi:glycosyltransferase involved in cell wall biosynthesis